jgi:hypothetical protein
VDRPRPVYTPLPLIEQRHGGGLVLADAVARLRCSKCGRRPPIVALVEKVEPPRAGSPKGWRIVLREGPSSAR